MQVRRISRLALVLAIPMLMAACGGDDGTGPDDGGATGGNAIPSMNASGSISWSGANARNITVTEMVNGQPTNAVWMVNANNPSTGFASPVTYGTLPSGAAQLAPSVSLKTGSTYRITLALVDGKGGYRDVTR